MKSEIFKLGFLTVLVSCTSPDSGNVSTYTVTRGDFENVLYIDGYVEPVRSTTATCPPYVEGVIGFLVEDGTYVKEGDLVAIVEVAELQTSYDSWVTALENAEVDLNMTRANLDMEFALLDAQVKNNEAETQIARLDSLQLQYATPNQVKIKELELAQVSIQKNRYEKKLQALDIIQQSEIRAKELQVRQLANRLQTAKEKLDALTVKAPKDGLAIRATSPMTRQKLQVGDPVWHLMPLVNLPEFTAMKVKIQAPETDYKYINIKDSVLFSFDAMPDNLAWGKIEMKSPVGRQYKEGSKVKFFDIEASIDSTLEMPEPGFTANCRIFLKQIKDTLLIPQIAIFEEDSLKVVYVKQGKHFDMYQVTTGITSPKEAIITAGLQGDEVISLVRPPASAIRKKQFLPPDSVRIKPEQTNGKAETNGSAEPVKTTIEHTESIILNKQ
ncbi:MAG: efflux RND transporter periplasmic adaptor subunit [Tannerella sp.]|nr:efflux RND transporter periplasmic adaptor subunit [Tannerella sp.]